VCPLVRYTDDLEDGNGFVMALLMYSMSDCPVCIKAKRQLRADGVAFTERQVDEEEIWQEEVTRLTQQNTVPVFVHADGRVEIGFEGEKG
jgi:glutaredoxin